MDYHSFFSSLIYAVTLQLILQLISHLLCQLRYVLFTLLHWTITYFMYPDIFRLLLGTYINLVDFTLIVLTEILSSIIIYGYSLILTKKALKPLEVLKKGLKTLQDQVKARKDRLQAWLAERKSISSQDERTRKPIWWMRSRF